MKSVGEVMGIGRSVPGSLKSTQSLEIKEMV
jgi:carbamoylphosphate synthase large subunit